MSQLYFLRVQLPSCCFCCRCGCDGQEDSAASWQYLLPRYAILHSAPRCDRPAAVAAAVADPVKERLPRKLEVHTVYAVVVTSCSWCGCPAAAAATMEEIVAGHTCQLEIHMLSSLHYHSRCNCPAAAAAVCWHRRRKGCHAGERPRRRPHHKLRGTRRNLARWEG